MYDGRDWSDDEWRGQLAAEDHDLRSWWRLTTFDRWLLWRNGIQPEWPEGKVIWLEMNNLGRGGVS